VNGERIVVVHVNRPHIQDGHYYVVVDRRGDQVLLVDAASINRWVSMDLLRRGVLEGMSGYILSIQLPRDVDRVYTLDEDLINIDLGEVEGGMGWIVARLPVKNTEHRIAIEKAKGSCSCFRRAAFEGNNGTFLGRGSSSTLELYFSRSGFGVGDTTRSVAIQLAEPGKHIVKVNVRAKVGLAGTGSGLAWSPTQLHYGFVQAAELADVREVVSFYLPDGIHPESIRTSSAYIRAVMSSATEPLADGRRLQAVTVTFPNVPRGALDEAIDVQLAGKDVDVVRIRVRAEVE
jgi:hypothetical protein